MNIMLPIANIFGFGNPTELLILAGVVVLFWGGPKLAGFGKNLAEGTKEFKKAIKDEPDEPVAQVAVPSNGTPALNSAPTTVGGGPHTSEATTVTAAAPGVKE